MHITKRKLIIGATFLSSLLFTSCSSLPHNDVLIFGTETTVALDVGSSATNGGTPEITIGYKREEAVWMPLLANAKSAKSPTTAGQLYTGSDSGKKDSYSVFASFGARLEGRSNQAKVGLAQFFATGIAAQNLADNKLAALALSVKPDLTGKAEAKAAAAPEGLSAADQKILEDAKNQAAALDQSAVKLNTCVKEKGEDYLDANFPPGSIPVAASNRSDFLTDVKTANGASEISNVVREYDFMKADVDDFIANKC